MNRPPETAGITGIPLRIVVLLAAAVFVNYVDRGLLSTAAPIIQADGRLSNAEMGILLSAFFWSYTPLQLVAGWLAQRMDVRLLYSVGLSVWSLATAATGLAGGFVSLLVLRVLVGVGESVAFPCNAKILADAALEHERGKANGLVSASFGLGPSVGTLVAGLMMASFGWRVSFVVFGLLSLIWLWPWFTGTRDLVVRGPTKTQRPPSYLLLLRNRAMWGASLGHFANNYGYYFVLTWLPLYLVKVHGYSVTRMATIGAVVYCIYAIAAAVTGWLSDRLIASGHGVNRVRKGVIVSGMLGAAVSMLACASANSTASVVFLAAAAVSFGLISPQLFAIAQTLAGPRAAGQWMGFQNTVGNFAGIAAPMITGYIIDRTGEYYWAFVLVSIVAFGGAVALGLVIPKVAPIQWLEEPGRATA